MYDLNRASPNLDQAEEAFREDGYVVLPQAWSRGTADAVREAAVAAFAAEPWLDPHYIHPPGTDLYDIADRRGARLAELLGDFRDHLINPRIAALLSRLLGDEPVVLSDVEPFRTSPSVRTPRPGEPGRDPARNAHVHSFSHFEPASGAVMGWFALEPISPDAGPMWIEPRSHRRNLALFDDVLAADPVLAEDLLALRSTGGGDEHWHGWGRRMQEVMTGILEDRIDAGDGARVPVLLASGDLLLFDVALTHGSTMPDRLGATRWSLVARYQGRLTREYGWPTWLETRPWARALEHVPPASYELAPCGEGWTPTNFDEVYRGMFWSAPLPPPTSE